MNNYPPHILSKIIVLKTITIESVNKIICAAKAEGLLGKSLRGSGFLAIGSFIENLGRFVRNIILARLLAPEAFGIMATIMASVAVIEATTQVGLRQSTIQNKRGGEEEFLNSVWWISSLRGLALYIIAFFASPYISAYFGQPDATNLLRIGFLVILINGLISPCVYLLEKELQFKKWVTLMQGAAISGVIIAVVSAFFLRNVWALILGFLSESFLRFVISFIFYPIKPKFKVTREYSGNVLQFSKKMFGLPLLMMIYAQLDIYVIGKVLSMKVLGMYVLVRSLADMPSTFFSKIADPIILPVFSKIQDNILEIRNILFKATKFAGYFLIPLACFLIFFAKPVLRLVYGKAYAALAIPFAIMNISVLILMMASMIIQVYFAVGQPNLHRNASIVRTVTFILLIYPATKIFGLTGTALASLIAMCLLISIQIIYARRLLNFSTLEYLSKWLPGLQVSIIIIIPGVLLNIFFEIEGLCFLILGAVLCFIAWGFSAVKIMLYHHEKSEKSA